MVTQYQTSASGVVAELIKNANNDSDGIEKEVLAAIESAGKGTEREKKILELQTGAFYLSGLERKKALNLLYESFTADGHSSEEETQAGIKAAGEQLESISHSCESVKQTIMDYRLRWYKKICSGRR